MPKPTHNLKQSAPAHTDLVTPFDELALAQDRQPESNFRGLVAPAAAAATTRPGDHSAIPAKPVNPVVKTTSDGSAQRVWLSDRKPGQPKSFPPAIPTSSPSQIPPSFTRHASAPPLSYSRTSPPSGRSAAPPRGPPAPTPLQPTAAPSRRPRPLAETQDPTASPPCRLSPLAETQDPATLPLRRHSPTLPPAPPPTSGRKPSLQPRAAPSVLERPSNPTQHTVSAPDVLSSSPAAPQSRTEPAPATSRRMVSAPVWPATQSKDENKDELVRCSAITAEGKRCRSHESKPLVVPWFCGTHRKMMLKEKKTKILSGDIKFDDWIPQYLDDKTKVALMKVMGDPISSADEPGCIYVLKVEEKDEPGMVHLKVGRATNVAKRTVQLAEQCPNKDQVLYGWWPGALNNERNMLRGCIQADEMGPNSHRLERLVHIELQDLVQYEQYRHPDFPNFPLPSADSANSTTTSSTTLLVTLPKPTQPRKSQTVSPAGKSDKPCSDCKKVHKEIFSFTRAETGRLKGKEYELIVRPIIEKWGRFVLNYKESQAEVPVKAEE